MDLIEANIVHHSQSLENTSRIRFYFSTWQSEPSIFFTRLSQITASGFFGSTSLRHSPLNEVHALEHIRECPCLLEGRGGGDRIFVIFYVLLLLILLFSLSVAFKYEGLFPREIFLLILLLLLLASTLMIFRCVSLFI